MNTSQAARLSVAAAMLAASGFSALSPAQAMPIAPAFAGSTFAADSTFAEGSFPATAFLKVQGRGDGGPPLNGEVGTPAWQAGQAESRRADRYGYGQGGWRGGPYYGPAYTPQPSAWCYYHPRRCR
ncbi:hypothetical protein SAMN05519103_08532 [Rhizobiales bacterium GAS113]|nr:hypothetical protein SAMN05519103_08532 [Rhizobiales bacterium GAS113]